MTNRTGTAACAYDEFCKNSLMLKEVAGGRFDVRLGAGHGNRRKLQPRPYRRPANEARVAQKHWRQNISPE